MDRPTNGEVTIGTERFWLGYMDLFEMCRVKDLLVAASIRQQAELKLVAAPVEPQGDWGAASENEEPEVPEKSPQQQAEDAVISTWVLAGSSLSEEVYRRIQTSCLKACKYYIEGSPDPIPVMMQNGELVPQGLKGNAPAVDELIQSALKFNISPFFVAAASKSQQKAG